MKFPCWKDTQKLYIILCVLEIKGRYRLTKEPITQLISAFLELLSTLYPFDLSS